MLLEVSKRLKSISTIPTIEKYLDVASYEEPCAGEWGLDPFLAAAIFETVSFVVRKEVRLAREAAQLLDPTWIELETEGDLLLLFDKL